MLTSSGNEKKRGRAIGVPLCVPHTSKCTSKGADSRGVQVPFGLMQQLIPKDKAPEDLSVCRNDPLKRGKRLLAALGHFFLNKL